MGEDQGLTDARFVVEEQYSSYEPNDDTPDCVFRKHESDWGPCGGVTYSDSFQHQLGTYRGKLFDGIVVPIPVCSAHHDVITGQIEKSDHRFNY